MTPTWKAVIGVILIFILGWFGGALTTIAIAKRTAVALTQRNPEALANTLERLTTRGLALSADQKEQLHAVIVQNLRARMDLQKQIQPQVKALNRQAMQQIDALLTADQQQRFHDNLVVFKSRFGRNPFSVGPEDRVSASAPASPAIGASTNAPATTN
jgi:hypothetical protein